MQNGTSRLKYLAVAKETFWINFCFVLMIKRWHQVLACVDRKENAAGRARKKELEDICIPKFMVPISHDRGVTEWFWYEGNKNGALFWKFVLDRFPHNFSKGNNQKGKLFLQYGDPSHNCKMSQESMDKTSCRLFKITPQSPLSKPHQQHISSCRCVCKERCHLRGRSKQRPMKTSVFALLTHFITFYQIL